MGNSAAARRQVAASEALSRARTNLPGLAVALALMGNSSAAGTLVDDLKHRYPSDYQVNASIPAAERFNPAAGIRQQPSRPCNHPSLRTGASLGIPPRLCALVYLRGHQGPAEFQKITAIALWCHGSYYTLSSGLGPRCIVAGDSRQARTAYQDFFALWKDADPDIPILKQAKAEYAKLQ